MLNGNRTKSETERDARDFYPTEPELCAAGVRLLPPDRLRALLGRGLGVLDAGAGRGNWGIAMRQYCTELGLDPPIVGVELFPEGNPAPPEYTHYIYDDFLSAPVPPTGVIVSNPPFSIAEAFVRKSLSVLPQDGLLLLLQRMEFSASQKRGRGLWKQYPLWQEHVCITRPSFTGNGKTDTIEYSLFLWIKGWRGETTKHWLDWCPAGRGKRRKAARHPDQLTLFGEDESCWKAS